MKLSEVSTFLEELNVKAEVMPDYHKGVFIQLKGQTEESIKSLCRELGKHYRIRSKQKIQTDSGITAMIDIKEK